jgi:hypothetical protein
MTNKDDNKLMIVAAVFLSGEVAAVSESDKPISGRKAEDARLFESYEGAVRRFL